MTTETGKIPDITLTQDHIAIQSVIFSHSRGLDRLDVDVLKSCYWPEAEVDYGSYKGPARAFCDLVVGALGEGYRLTRHCLGNTLIHVDGQKARVESYCTAWHLLPSQDEEMVFSGRYLDLLERRGDCWKMLHRTVVMDWSRQFQVADMRESEAFQAMKKGTHRAQDPLYALLDPNS